jgi:predicted ABC-type ATPase
VVARIADRAYIYDNSVDNASAQLLFRTSEGKLIKHYGDINPWALEILREIDPESLSKDGS